MKKSEKGKKIERIEVDYNFEDNDASYSAFGWDFQVNAGIFLFLRFIKEADSIAIESKYQDIELSLENKKIYAQAKSLQSESGARNENEKLRDALVSLAKVKTEETDLLIYISNLCAPIDNEKDKYRNTVVPFASCSTEHQDFIRNQIQTVINRLEKANKDPKISGAKRAKNELLIKRLQSFKYDQLSVASIYPFDEKTDRYRVIKEETVSFLANVLKINSYEAVGYVDRIISHWQQELAFNATVSDKKNERKYISKKDFLWTVIAVSVDKKYAEFIEDSLSEPIDSDIEEQCQQYLSNDKNLYHERFEFLNRVLKSYRDFAVTKASGYRKDEAYIRSESWKDFEDEFSDVKDDLLREYIVKSYIYRIINRHQQKTAIAKEINLCL